MRKLLTFIAMLAMLLVTMAATAATTLAATSNCSDATGRTDLFAGRSFTAPTNSRGVKAAINTAPGFGDCNNSNGLDLSGGSSVWVAIEDDINNAAILQVGVINCHNPNSGVNPPCGGSNGLGERYFWAYGGCNGVQPNVRDLGPATSDAHNFDIYRSPSGASWYITIDGAFKPGIAFDDPAISCWDNRSDRQVAWEGERWDGGDSFGIPIGTTFGSMAYYTSASTWQLISINGCSSVGGSNANPASCSMGGNGYSMYVSSAVDAP